MRLRIAGTTRLKWVSLLLLWVATDISVHDYVAHRCGLSSTIHILLITDGRMSCNDATNARFTQGIYLVLLINISEGAFMIDYYEGKSSA